MNISESIKKEAKELLQSGQVKTVVGYKAAPEGDQSPTFAHKPDEVDVMTFSPLSFFNLTRYLPWIKTEVAVVVKGCDSRALLQLISENKVDREKVKVIGVNCPGVVDERKIESKGISFLDVTEAEINNKVVIKTKNSKKEFTKEEILADKCLGCAYPNPLITDIKIGDEQEAKNPFKSEAEQNFEKLSIEAKEKFWQEEFTRCNRCMACRNICPMCYCQDQCSVDLKSPKWVSESIDPKNNQMFHMIRAMHLAGRCVECGECERACPQGIPLTFIYKKMNEEIKDLYDFVPGTDINASSLLGSYCEDDPEAE